MNRLRFGLDFDDTLTAAPEVFVPMVLHGRSGGHEFVCISQRYNDVDNQEIVDGYLEEHGILMPVHLTSYESKLAYVERIGLRIDIWIDDYPEALVNGRW